MKRNIIIIAGVIIGLVVVYLAFGRNSDADTGNLFAKVKNGPFRVEIETTGELEAKNSVKILGPGQLRDFRIWEVTINSIVPEGTVVKKGEWVASLDPSEFQNRFNEKKIELEKANSKFVQIQLDTTLTMRQSRDELINLKYGLDERRIILEQSKFEPPATIKQNEINLDKAIRAYEQAIENYSIKKRQNIEKMREVFAELKKVQNEHSNMTMVMEAFNIQAPEDGMVIYEKGWDGRAIKAGSRINMWEPTVATLPDLTKMMSKTYVNEVDVRLVKPGQRVEIGLDADPDKKLIGKVTAVANVGEQRPNSDSKVFEVMVEIEGSDLTLRPSMTTSNRIVAKVIEKSSFIPLEALHSLADTLTYVIVRDGISMKRKEVIATETNATDVIITAGLSDDDEIYLSFPKDSESSELILLPEMNGKRKKKKTEDQPEVVALPTTVKN